jgi:hypothetical protein
MSGMKRIKQIIEALKTLRTDRPSDVIDESWSNIKEYIDNALGDGKLQDSDVDLIGRLIDAVIDLAKDMERPAKTATEDKS